MGGLGDHSPLDVGVLAEALLFYGHVHLVAERDMLRQLIGPCGPEAIVALMDEGVLSVAFLAQPAGIQTDDSMSSPVGEHAMVSRFHYDLANEAEKAFRDATQSAARGRNRASKRSEAFRQIGYEDGFPSRFYMDLADAAYVRGAVTDLLRLLAPGYSVPPDLKFDVVRHASQFRIETNIDFAAANTYHQAPSDAPHTRHLDTPLLLLYLLEAQADLEFASHFRAEIASSPVGESLTLLRSRGLFAATKHHMEEIASFEKMVLEGHRIREAINSGERNYQDVMALLRRARKVRSWLIGQAPSADLAREYYQAITAKTWVDRLPGKPFRWSLVNVMASVLAILLEP